MEEFAIIVRLDSLEGRIGGLDENGAVVFARLLESYGADALNVSAVLMPLGIKSYHRRIWPKAGTGMDPEEFVKRLIFR